MGCLNITGRFVSGTWSRVAFVVASLARLIFVILLQRKQRSTSKMRKPGGRCVSIGRLMASAKEGMRQTNETTTTHPSPNSQLIDFSLILFLSRRGHLWPTHHHHTLYVFPSDWAKTQPQPPRDIFYSNLSSHPPHNNLFFHYSHTCPFYVFKIKRTTLKKKRKRKRVGLYTLLLFLF